MTNLCLPSIFNITCYSLLQSCIKIENLIAYAKNNNHQVVFITDFKYMHGYIEFYNQAVANNLKPILGLVINYQNAQLILLAKNKKGYLNLVKISSNLQINNTWFNDLIIIVNDGEFNETRFDVYFANDLENNKGVLIRENYFFNQDDYQTYCAIRAIAKNTSLEEEIEINDYLKNKYLNQNYDISEESILVKNLWEIIAKCEYYDIIKSSEIIKFPTPNNVLASDYLNSLVNFGFKKIVLPKIKNNNLIQKYYDRLSYELKIINDMQFTDYFLIVHDYINFAKNNGIYVGPGRGSVAGSLVAYCLGITKVDPIFYDLYFERFLNPFRSNMPDIDVDFMDIKREKVINYIYEKYSPTHVAQIITFQTIKARSAIRDVGRILKIDLRIIDAITKKIPLAYDDDLNKICDYVKEIQIDFKNFPQLFNIASKIVNFPRQVGMHAAGIVLSNQKLGEVVPIMNNDSGYVVTQFSMNYLETLGLIKMDLLGLRNLTTIAEIIQLVYKNHNKKIIIEEMNLDDDKVFESLKYGDTTGIFQLESPGMTKLVIQFQPKTIEDISLISALFRPGPQKNINYFVNCRFNKIKHNSLHPRLDKILNPTYGIIVYQEQLIAVVMTVMNSNLAQADIFRRAISKKDDQKLLNLKNNFIKKGLKNNFNINELGNIWSFIYEFANYGFNHSHSISYAIISYWLMWLKTYFPLEFYCVLLSSFSNVIQTIHVAKKVGLVINQPSINFSEADFSVFNNQIYFGLRGIKGLGFESVKKILLIRQLRKSKKFDNLEECLEFLFANKITYSILKIINHAGGFDELFNKHESRLYVDEYLKKITNPQTGSSFILMKKSNVLLKSTYPIFNDEHKKIYNDYQKELLGYSFGKNKISEVKNLYNFNNNLLELKNQKNFLEDYLVVVETVKEAKTKNNNKMLWIVVSDETMISSKAIPYFGEKINLVIELAKSHKPCIVTFEVKKTNIRIKDFKSILN